MDIDIVYPLESVVKSPIAAPLSKNPFQTFWMAGYECSDKINAFGERVDLLNTTGHIVCIDQDYSDISQFEMGTVREGIRWSQVESRPYEYDWSTVAHMIHAGQRHHIQQIWDMCHFGFPDDLTPLHPMFARRFASLCRNFVTFYRTLRPDGELIIVPINEVSFLSWLGGDVRGTSPFCVGQGWEVKYRLMKAYIEGIEAMKEVDPNVRILTTEPLVNIVPPVDALPHQQVEAILKNEEQFQVTDILCGRMCPELNGKPEYLDIIGYNYYYNNQWELHTNHYLDWKYPENDTRYIPLHKLLISAHARYNCRIVLSETSHPKEDRHIWMKAIGVECALVLLAGVPLSGICWYPVLDRPDWDNLSDWHQSGLWDGAPYGSSIRRSLHLPLAEVLMKTRDHLGQIINDMTSPFITPVESESYSQKNIKMVLHV